MAGVLEDYAGQQGGAAANEAAKQSQDVINRTYLEQVLGRTRQDEEAQRAKLAQVTVPTASLHPEAAKMAVSTGVDAQGQPTSTFHDIHHYIGVQGASDKYKARDQMIQGDQDLVKSIVALYPDGVGAGPNGEVLPGKMHPKIAQNVQLLQGTTPSPARDTARANLQKLVEWKKPGETPVEPITAEPGKPLPYPNAGIVPPIPTDDNGRPYRRTMVTDKNGQVAYHDVPESGVERRVSSMMREAGWTGHEPNYEQVRYQQLERLIRIPGENVLVPRPGVGGPGSSTTPPPPPGNPAPPRTGPGSVDVSQPSQAEKLAYTQKEIDTYVGLLKNPNLPEDRRAAVVGALEDARKTLSQLQAAPAPVAPPVLVTGQQPPVGPPVRGITGPTPQELAVNKAAGPVGPKGAADWFNPTKGFAINNPDAIVMTPQQLKDAGYLHASAYGVKSGAELTDRIQKFDAADAHLQRLRDFAARNPDLFPNWDPKSPLSSVAQARADMAWRKIKDKSDPRATELDALDKAGLNIMTAIVPSKGTRMSYQMLQHVSSAFPAVRSTMTRQAVDSSITGWQNSVDSARATFLHPQTGGAQKPEESRQPAKTAAPTDNNAGVSGKTPAQIWQESRAARQGVRP